ncbi:MAG: translation elongation factor Ts [Spirochaetes bacterium]|nr:translation elongation factor Ts [Spirochaetota bacterium]
MDIKSTDIKNLREKTGAGMMDCKKALTEAGGDSAKAEKLLKEWGLAGVEKRAGRATNEGRIFLKEGSGKAAIVELACETDFVSRNDDFIKFGNGIAAKIFAGASAVSLESEVKGIASVIKENISLKRVATVTVATGEMIHSYMHGDGRIGVVVKIRSDKPEALAKPEVTAFAHDLALHIAAFNPVFLDQGKIPDAYKAEQKEIFLKQVEGDERMKGKPEKIIEGILVGKMKKLMADICLLDQGFVKDEKLSVAKVMADIGKSAGATLSIAEFLYLRVGVSN